MSYANTLAVPRGGGVRPSGRLRSFLAVAGGATLLLVAGAGAARAADVEAGRRKAQPCVTCHGSEGNATIVGMPSIAGQPSMYTHWQLIKFRDGRRKDQQMSPFAEKLSDTDMADLAAYYATQRPQARPAEVDPAKVAAGRVLAERHHCTSCHRPALTGHEQVPRLAGQDLAYLVRLIRGFKHKTASDLDGAMTMSAQPLTEADIEPLAHYISSLTLQ